jgi:hypothetical protein
MLKTACCGSSFFWIAVKHGHQKLSEFMCLLLFYLVSMNFFKKFIKFSNSLINKNYLSVKTFSSDQNCKFGIFLMFPFSSKNLYKYFRQKYDKIYILIKKIERKFLLIINQNFICLFLLLIIHLWMRNPLGIIWSIQKSYI